MMTTAALLLALITSTPGAEAAGEPVLLDFHSEGCPPCRQMRPAIEQLIQKGYQVKSVDAEESPDLFERYQVRDVPTFIVVDPSGRTMARTKGLQPARQLADLYRIAKAKIAADQPAGEDLPAGARLTAADADGEEDARSQDRPDDEAGAVAATFTNPKPWETVVRIKVHDAGSIGLGSGTVIYSTPQESIILTCAHIFKLQGGRQPRQASQFPNKITVDLFDGKLSGQNPPSVHKVETVVGEALDYDFNLDVGLIRIRPGRRLPASRVVPASWRPEVRMPMITVGCSEGHDATTWETMISQPIVRGLSNSPNYEAIECKRAPKQGRSGGGLYTSNGYVAGVCDFAEPRGNHGLYASPRSIHRLLDRNHMTVLYTPATGRSGTLLAQGRPSTRGASTPTFARAQSPERDESSPLTIPPPGLLGIQSPTVAKDRPGRTAWQPSRPSTPPPSVEPDAQKAELNVSPAADSDRFASMNDTPAPAASAPAPSVRPLKPSKWHRVTTPAADPATE